VRLEELGLTAFGRFLGRTLRLEPGLNIIYGPNEAGKSTVQRFVAAMLYGQKKKGLRREPSDDAARFRPWAGGEYRGHLLYSLDDGRALRVERQLDPKHDDVWVYHEATGADLTGTFPMDRRKERLFALEHLGLDEESFRSTAWVGQLEAGRMEAGRELLARVANLQESGREDLSVQQALVWLDEQARAIGTDRAATRPYGRVGRAITEKRQELERASAVREQVRGYESRLAELRAVLGSLDEELVTTRHRLAWARLREARARLARLEQAEGRVSEAEARVQALAGYAAVPVERLGALKRALAEAEEASAWAAAVVVPTITEAAQSRGLWGAVVGLAAAAVGAAGMRQVPLAVALGIAAGALTLWLALQGARRRASRALAAAEAERSRQGALERARRAQAEARAILAEAGVADPAEFERACDGREAWVRARAEAETLRSLLGAETPAAVAAEVQRLQASAVSPQPPDKGLNAAAALDEELRRLEARRAARHAEACDLEARVETTTAGVADLADLQRDLAGLTLEKSRYDEELAALELARRTIAEVSADMHREFAPRLHRATGEAVSALTGGRYDAVRIDEGMSIRTIAGGTRTVDLESLSGATVDQFYLALRLALLRLVTEGRESVPLFLDDPLVQYDDDRARQAITLLAGEAAHRQVVLFTCHTREVSLAKDLRLKFHLIDLNDTAVEAT